MENEKHLVKRFLLPFSHKIKGGWLKTTYLLFNENICYRRIFSFTRSVYGVGVAVPHRTRINTAWNWLPARNVKSTGSAGLIAVNVTATGFNVPGMNAGMLTTALTGAPTTVSDCNPVPAFTWSTVTARSTVYPKRCDTTWE